MQVIFFLLLPKLNKAKGDTPETEEAEIKTSYKCTKDIVAFFYFRGKRHRKQSDLSAQPWYFLPAFLRTKIKMLPFHISSP